MDLAQPLSTLIPTLEADVLTVLARSSEPLTGRRLAQLGRRGSHPAVQKVLDRLVDAGLVEMQPAGPARLYRLNRDHLLAGPVLACVAGRQTLLERLRGAITSWQQPCVHASLFGSLARGEAGPRSDIDVLVVRPARVPVDDPVWQRQLHDLELRAARWTGNPLAWFETTEGDLLRAMDGTEEPVVSLWRDDAVNLAGEPLTSLLTRISGAAATVGR